MICKKEESFKHSQSSLTSICRISFVKNLSIQLSGNQELAVYLADILQVKSLCELEYSFVTPPKSIGCSNSP